MNKDVGLERAKVVRLSQQANGPSRQKKIINQQLIQQQHQSPRAVVRPYTEQSVPTPGTNACIAKMATRKTQSKPKRSKSKDASSIGVYLRLRPLKVDEPSIYKINDHQVKTLPPDNSNAQVYSFTKVFDNAPQSQIFEQVAQPIVEDFIVSAKDGLLFTYGITGSGKTYTMEGTRSDPGLIYRSIDFLFNSIGAQQTDRSLIESDGQNSYRLNWDTIIQQRDHELGLYPNLEQARTPSALPSVIKWQQRTKESGSVSVDPIKYFSVFISLVELYNKQVHDLFEDLDPNNYEKKRREIRTDQQGMSYVANVVEAEVKSADEAVELYKRGISRRKTGSTALNQESSRGHCVLNLRLVQIHKSPYDNHFDEKNLVSSQLCLVDLAGSERTKRSGVTGGALHEAGSINNSLGALRKCIRSLRDREPTSNIQYREYSLTRLFKSYFEGHGLVRMVLCVKPSAVDFYENNSAMEFGLLSQEVAVDYASPPKILRRSRSMAQDAITAQMKEFFCKKSHHYKPDPDLTNEEFISDWIEKLKADQENRRKYIETAHAAQREVRRSILSTVDENASLKQQYEKGCRDLKVREDQLERARVELQNTEQSCQGMNDKIHQLERQVRHLEAKDKQSRTAVYNFELYQARNEKAYKEILNLIKSDQTRSEYCKRIQYLLKKLKSQDVVNSAPSAPEMEPLQSSSPVDIPNPSTTETTDSHTVPTLSNTSSEAIEYHDPRLSTSPIKFLTSPHRGVPIINPKHNRSLSCSSLYWIKHVPNGMDTGGSVLQPKIKNGRVVRNLKSRDLFDKKVGNYAIINQTAESNGEVVTSVTKGNVIRTPTNGVQVHFNDVETMKQESPKRRRAVSDAQFAH